MMIYKSSLSFFAKAVHIQPAHLALLNNSCHRLSIHQPFSSFGNVNSVNLKPQKVDFSVKSMSSSSEVLSVDKNCKGIMILNRPKALNALNENMVELMYSKLSQWQTEKKLIILKGEGGKAFCAGGDVVGVTKGRKGDLTAIEFFRKEYRLNNLIGSYKVPFVSFITGIVMGGGCGVSINGRFRVASEKSLFAMPETAIGLFPDVGGSYFLPKLKGGLGMFLALTGYRLKGWDLVRSGLATHYCPHGKIDDLQGALLSLPENLNHEHVDLLLDKFCSEEGEFSLTPHLKDIKECFTAPTLKEIIKKLKQSDSDFCRSQLATLESVSPTSLVITHEELKRGAKMTLEECLKMEYRMVHAIYQHNDFFEGVRARLIDKDNKPQWQPASLEKVDEEETIRKYFSNLPEERELKF